MNYFFSNIRGLYILLISSPLNFIFIFIWSLTQFYLSKYKSKTLPKIFFWRKILKKLKDTNSKINILEIGSYKGESSKYFLEEITNSIITCVDTWEGSDENKDRKENFSEVEKAFDEVEKKYKDRLIKKKLTSQQFFYSLNKDDLKHELYDFLYVLVSCISSEIS